MRGTMTSLPLNTEDGMTEEEFLAHLDKLDKEIDDERAQTVEEADEGRWPY